MEERNEIIEMLVHRWNAYYGEFKFWQSSVETSASERLALKYNTILTELTHIIARVLEKGYAETYNILSSNYKNTKILKNAQLKINI